MLGKRLSCLLSFSLLFNTYNVNMTTPFQATAVVKGDNIKINTNDELGLIKQPIVLQLEKDKEEFERIKAEKLRQEELKKKQEDQQKERDAICYYNPNNITEISGISVQKAYELLKGTTYQTEQCAQAFVDAEHLDTPVNAVFFIGVTRKESLHGRSGLAKYDNNISSWRVSRGNYKTFDSKVQCIKETAQLLSKEYLHPSGQYYKGVSIEGINTYYCEGGTVWADGVNEVISDMKHGRF